MKLMNRWLVAPLLVVTLTVGCGRATNAPAVTEDQLGQIQSIAASQSPSTIQTAQSLNPNEVGPMLNALASNPALSSAQSAILADPAHQQVFQGLIQLAQGGAQNSLASIASMLTTAAAGGSSLDTIIADLTGVLNVAAPILETLNPALTPFISVVQTMLPIVQQVLDLIFPASASH